MSKTHEKCQNTHPKCKTWFPDLFAREKEDMDAEFITNFESNESGFMENKLHSRKTYGNCVR